MRRLRKLYFLGVLVTPLLMLAALSGCISAESDAAIARAAAGMSVEFNAVADAFEVTLDNLAEANPELAPALLDLKDSLLEHRAKHDLLAQLIVEEVRQREFDDETEQLVLELLNRALNERHGDNGGGQAPGA